MMKPAPADSVVRSTRQPGRGSLADRSADAAAVFPSGSGAGVGSEEFPAAPVGRA
jgi:hypothetical protein